MPRGLLYGVLVFVFLASFLVYLSTLNPAFQPDDSGETIDAFVKLIPEHPSGYALHSLVGHLLNLLPVGGVAWRSNLLGALGGAGCVTLTALFIFGSLKEKKGRDGRAARASPGILLSGMLTGSLSLAFSKTFWLEALSAKGSIYILQVCLLLAFLFFFQRWLEGSPNRKPGQPLVPFLLALFLVALRFGIGLETLSLFTLSFLISLAALRNTAFHWFPIKKIPFFLTVVLLGASVLLLPPLEQAAGRVNLWADAGTYRGFRFLSSNSVIHQEMGSVFWKGLTGIGKTPLDWGSFREHGPQLLAQWKRAWDHLAWDMGWWAWIPAFFGLRALVSRRFYWLLTFNLALIFLTTAAMVAGVEWNPAEFWCIDKFLLPANLFWALLVGVGTYELSGWTGFWGSGRTAAKRAPTGPLKGIGSWPFVPFLFLSWAGPFLCLAANHPLNDQSRQTAAYDYAMDLMKSLKTGALFLAEGDNALFSTLFVQGGMDKRKDVTLVPVMDLWTEGGIGVLPHLLPGLAESGELEHLREAERVRTCMEKLIQRFGGRRPIEISADFNLLYQCYFEGLDAVARKKDLFLVMRPCGLLMEYGGGPSKPPHPGFLPLYWIRPALPQGRVSEPMDLLLANKTQSYLNVAEYDRSRRLWDQADRLYEEALGMCGNPRLLSETWRGRGDLYLAMDLPQKALEAYQSSVTLFANKESYYQLIAGYSHSARREEALKAAQELVGLFPREALSWYKLAACEEAVGDKAAALQAYRRGQELERNRVPDKKL